MKMGTLCNFQEVVNSILLANASYIATKLACPLMTGVSPHVGWDVDDTVEAAFMIPLSTVITARLATIFPASGS